jgi:hypothetical protein
MSTRFRSWPAALAMAMFFAIPSLAADDETTKKDLMAVIALQGLPCGQVVSVKTQGDNDHIASCKDGNRYHVFLNSAGRVVVEKQ